MDGMTRASESSPAARKRGLGLISRTNRWLATGAVVLTAAFSVAAAKGFHSTSSSANSNSNSTTSSGSSDTSTTSSDGSSSTSSLQSPTQHPSSTSSSSTGGVVSGGS
jgi:cytoskeletal protein RodZ